MAILQREVLVSALIVYLAVLSEVQGAQKDASNHNDVKEKRYRHPCDEAKCSSGTVCVVKPDRTTSCECVSECRPEYDDRKKVCSNFNETYDSLCHLHQMACFCRSSDERCVNEKYEHLHVDYYGSCREIGICSDSEMADFPRRMREWLFNIMKDLARRKALNSEYEKLEKESEKSHGRQWVNAVIWKFCDLDIEPTNRVVSRHELYPLTAPLKAMEHCIAPFLDSCDADNDHQVTLTEWGTCLGLEVDEIQDKCHKMHHGTQF